MFIHLSNSTNLSIKQVENISFLNMGSTQHTFEVLGKDTSQSLICNIIDMAIMTLWQYRVMGGSAL